MEKLANDQKEWLESNRKDFPIDQCSIHFCYKKDIDSLTEEIIRKKNENKKLIKDLPNELKRLQYKIDILSLDVSSKKNSLHYFYNFFICIAFIKVHLNF